MKLIAHRWCLIRHTTLTCGPGLAMESSKSLVPTVLPIHCCDPFGIGNGVRVV
jgi:hypothetical protein